MTVKRVSMKDIALELNITVDAVSKALKDSPRISEKTKRDVALKAKELGYVKNNLAYSLKNGKSNFVAVYLNSLFNPYFAVMTTKLMTGLKNAGYQAVVSLCDSHLLEEKAIKFVFKNNCAAVITLVEPSKDTAFLLKQNGIPVYLLGVKSDDDYVNYIKSNDMKGGELVGKYFLESKNQVGLYVSDSLSETSQERKNGFLKAVNHKKQTFVLESIPEMDLSKEVIDTVISNKVDFIFCFSDYLANKVKRWLLSNSRSLYSNIHIVGYDNISDYCDTFDLLDSIKYDMDELCKLAIDDMVRVLNSGKMNEVKLKEIVDVTLKKY